MSLLKSQGGEIWAGGEFGITHIVVDKEDQISFKNYMAKTDGRGPPIFRDLLEGPDGTVWAVGDQGMYVIEGNKLIPYTNIGMEVNMPIFTDSVVDDRNMVWLATQGDGL